MRYLVMSRPESGKVKEKKPWDNLPLKDILRADRIEADFKGNAEKKQTEAFLEELL
jgi:hypothetical protein